MTSWDRILKTDRKKYEVQIKIWDHMERVEKSGEFEVDVPKKKNSDPRVASVSIRFSQIDLKPPQRYQASRDKNGKLPPVSVYVISVKEEHPPKGAEALEWMLLTSVKVSDLSDAKERIDWYKSRWHIENLHKVLKSGCRVESCRLETADRLKRYLTLMSIVAWRLYSMTHLNRVDPNQECTTILNDHEWKALYCKIHKTSMPPQKIPTIRQTVRWIAQLGGFLARKHDGEPGITTIWRGWQRLYDISENYRLFNTA